MDTLLVCARVGTFENAHNCVGNGTQGQVMTATAGWYEDPTGRFDTRFFDGSTWTVKVKKGTSAEARDELDERTRLPHPGGSDAASATAQPWSKRRKMSALMLGCGGVVVISAFLPWATSSVGSLGGFEWGFGKFSALLGVALGLYAYQGVREGSPPLRFHGWAIAVVVVLLLTAVIAQTSVDTTNQATLGLASVTAGTGLLLTLIAGALAIWPLVVLRKDAKQAAMAGGAAA
jgi:hypothetical protein